MRNLLFAGTAGLSLALGAAAAFAATSADAPKTAPLVEGRAAYVTPAGEFGQMGNDFGPDFKSFGKSFGAPASARDFGGAEVSATQSSESRLPGPRFLIRETRR
jgi:hypothetical protein